MQLNPKEAPNMQDLIKLASTPAGNALIALLKKQDNLYDAARKAAQGDSEELEQTLQRLISNPEVKAVLKELEGL